MTVTLRGGGDRGFSRFRRNVVRVETETGLANPATVVGSQGIATVEAAIRAGDVARLHAIDREIVPHSCARCPAVYCPDHLKHWLEFEPDSGFFDDARGRCPNGRVWMLYD